MATTATTSAATLPANTVAAPPDRLLSLDVLRGFTMAAMVLVNDPGSGAVYTQLDHAEWNGATFTDMIFPCFMVMVGVATTLSFSSRLNRGASHRNLALHTVRRGALIIFLGLFLNFIFTLNLAHLRYPGVLQRIGLCYALGALLYLALPGPDQGHWRRLREGVIAGVAVFLLVLYWLLLKVYPTPGFGAGHMDSFASLPAVVDRAVFGVNHIYRWATTPGMTGPTYDPEGVLSTLPALTNVLFGILAGEQLRSNLPRRKQCGVLAAMGTTLWLAGLGLSYWMPLNKKLWTSTFALFTSGMSILCLAGLLYLIDIRRVRRGWSFLLIFGTNAILAYVLSDVVAWVFGRVRFHVAGHRMNLHTLLFHDLFETWMSPKMASLSFALLYVLIVAALVYPLYRKRIFLRI